jgi:hypothetical protein
MPRRKRKEDLARFRQHRSGGKLTFGKRDRKDFADAHDFTGASHFWTKHDIDAGELTKRKDTFFDRNVTWNGFGRHLQFRQRFPSHDLGGDAGNGNARGLGNERHRATGTGIDLQYVNRWTVRFDFDSELNIHQPHDVQPRS